MSPDYSTPHPLATSRRKDASVARCRLLTWIDAVLGADGWPQGLQGVAAAIGTRAKVGTACAVLRGHFLATNTPGALGQLVH